MKSVRTLCTKTELHRNVLDILSRFSAWTKLISFVARMQRLSNGIKGTHPTTPDERLKPELTIVKFVQHETFPDAISTLCKSENLPRTNSLKPLEPVLQDGILRVGGRLTRTALPSLYKHPIILPKDSHITLLILSHAHIETFHQGRGFTLNKLRSLEYWIVGGSKTIANYIRHCKVCRKLRRPTETQRMAEPHFNWEYFISSSPSRRVPEGRYVYPQTLEARSVSYGTVLVAMETRILGPDYLATEVARSTSEHQGRSYCSGEGRRFAAQPVVSWQSYRKQPR